jgi:hypothetical protein
MTKEIENNKVIANIIEAIEQDTAFKSGEGYAFSFNDENVSIMLIQTDDGWLPDIRCDSWQASASSFDAAFAKATPQEAFLFGACCAIGEIESLNK